MAAAADDGRVTGWDLRSGTQTWSIDAHADGAQSCAFKPGDASFILTAGADRACKLWDLRSSSKPVRAFDQHHRTDARRRAMHHPAWLSATVFAVGGEGSERLAFYDATSGALTASLALGPTLTGQAAAADAADGGRRRARHCLVPANMTAKAGQQLFRAARRDPLFSEQAAGNAHYAKSGPSSRTRPWATPLACRDDRSGPKPSLVAHGQQRRHADEIGVISTENRSRASPGLSNATNASVGDERHRAATIDFRSGITNVVVEEDMQAAAAARDPERLVGRGRLVVLGPPGVVVPDDRGALRGSSSNATAAASSRHAPRLSSFSGGSV